MRKKHLKKHFFCSYNYTTYDSFELTLALAYKTTNLRDTIISFQNKLFDITYLLKTKKSYTIIIFMFVKKLKLA